MLLQTASGWQFGLLVLVLLAVGFVSYWVYRDADARGMDDAPYWGAAVGTAFVLGVVVGGIVAVGVYLSARPDEYAGHERPFEALRSSEPPSDRDPAHADLPPVPELTAERVETASPTTLRGYARRYDRLDARSDPETIRAALRELVTADETGRLGPTVEEEETDHRRRSGGPGIDVGGDDDHRRHLGRPRVRGEDTEDAPSRAEADEARGPAETATADDGEGADDDDRFEWAVN